MSRELAALDERFTNGEVRQFRGRGGQTFDYIEDETVMDRLDEVLGKGEWSLEVEPISVADGIVKVTLRALGQTYEDFGYASNAGPQAESLKEAVSDGIRRCGRYLGIGRYLYKKHDSEGQAPVPPQRPARPVAPARTSTQLPELEEAEELRAAFGEPVRPFAPIGQPENAVPVDECPIHRMPWAGKPGDLYHGPKGIVDGGYCRHPDNVRRRAS